MVRSTRVKDLLKIQDRMNCLLEDSVRGSRHAGQEEMDMILWMPLVNNYETESTVVLKAELSGIQQEEYSRQNRKQDADVERRTKIWGGGQSRDFPLY